MGDYDEGHFRIGGLKMMKDCAEGHRFAGGPRFQCRDTVDMCRILIRGAWKYL
jgi:hypothetical protein